MSESYYIKSSPNILDYSLSPSDEEKLSVRSRLDKVHEPQAEEPFRGKSILDQLYFDNDQFSFDNLPVLIRANEDLISENFKDISDISSYPDLLYHSLISDNFFIDSAFPETISQASDFYDHLKPIEVFSPYFHDDGLFYGI